ncbi:hypothetical protein NKR23_g2138 [Pleurostoma richardsiae]|uniref:Uncharacterized protein n=1 Tax=Pleurostoma richardsiae TaxID=41990 RepID=A0AA38RR19_9PEZI|nr:hypothetical protein NKR23_g2138 [Pleurostoma richardsiae]
MSAIHAQTIHGHFGVTKGLRSDIRRFEALQHHSLDNSDNIMQTAQQKSPIVQAAATATSLTNVPAHPSTSVEMKDNTARPYRNLIRNANLAKAFLPWTEK